MTSSTRIKAASTLLLLLIWQVAASWVGRPILLPSPYAVWGAIRASALREDFFPSIFATLGRFGIGFGIAFIAAFMLGLLAGRFQATEAALAPFVQLVRSIPTVAVILLVMVWLHSERAPIAVGVLMAFPVLYFNVIEGVRSVDRKLLEMAKVYRLSSLTVFWKLYVPSMSSYVMAGVLSATGIGLKMVIAAEVFSQPSLGIGTRFQMARMGLDTAGLFGWAVWVVCLSLLVDLLLKGLFRILKRL